MGERERIEFIKQGPYLQTFTYVTFVTKQFFCKFERFHARLHHYLML